MNYGRLRAVRNIKERKGYAVVPFGLQLHAHGRLERDKKREFVKASFVIEVSHTLSGSLQILLTTSTPLEGGARL